MEMKKYGSTPRKLILPGLKEIGIPKDSLPAYRDKLFSMYLREYSRMNASQQTALQYERGRIFFHLQQIDSAIACFESAGKIINRKTFPQATLEILVSTAYSSLESGYLSK